MRTTPQQQAAYGYPQTWAQVQPMWHEPIPPPRPPARSRLGLWLGLAAGATALVIVAGYVLAAALRPSRPASFEGLATLPTASDQPPSSDWPSPPPLKEASEVTVVRPDRIGARARITDGEYATKAANTEVKLRSKLGPGKSVVVAYYGTADRKTDQIYVVGSTIAGPLKRSTFDAQFEKAGPSITGIVWVPAGAAGGYISCGEMAQPTMPVAVCAFSNRYDFVVIQWYNRHLNDEIKKEVLAIRALVER
jgi:hypothetical protein